MDGETFKLTTAAWASATARTTDLAYQDGVAVKNGDATKRYLGSFRTTGVSGQCEDSLANRYVWNMYNRVLRPMAVYETTNSWEYHTATWHAANASSANALAFIRGLNEDMVSAIVMAACNSSVASTIYSGIGVDSTSSPTVSHVASLFNSTATGQAVVHYNALLSAGYHTLTWLEKGYGSGTQTWYGDTNGNSGIVGSILA